MMTAATINPTSQRPAHWLTGLLGRSVALLRRLGPYAAIELLLPGGSVLALLLWLYRRRQSRPLALSVPRRETVIQLRPAAPALRRPPRLAAAGRQATGRACPDRAA